MKEIANGADTEIGRTQFKKICEIIERNGRNPSRLIPILQEVQEEYRYLPNEAMTFVATNLGITPARVYGVATFYAHFTLEPKGRHIIKLCDGTACHVKNSIPILEALRKKLGLTEERQTSRDMLFTVETVSCLGACGLAPVMVIDDRVFGQMSPEKALEIVEGIIKTEGVAINE